MTVPYIFADASQSIPLAELDANFAAVGNSTGISYNEGNGNAVSRTVQSKLAEKISVLDFGADPTGVADSTTAIQNAINSVETGTYPNFTSGTIYIPSGTYKTTGPLYVRRSTSLIGDGNASSIIKPTSALTSSCLFVGVNGDVPRTNSGFIQSIGFDGSATTSTSAIGINIWASGTQIIDCFVNGFYYNLYAYQSWTASINKCQFTQARKMNIWIDRECHNFSVTQSRITYSAGTGIRVSSSNSVTIQTCDIEQNTGSGLVHDSDNVVASRNLTVIDTYFEANGPNAVTPGTGNDIYLLESVGTDSNGVSILNCYFEPGIYATINVDHRGAGSVNIINSPNASIVTTNGGNLVNVNNGYNDYRYGTTSLPSNPLAGNQYSSFGNSVLETIQGVVVGTTPVQLTKNGTNGGVAFLNVSQPSTGGNYNLIVSWTANQTAVVVGYSGGLTNLITMSFTCSGPYNGQLFASISSSAYGTVIVNGMTITQNRY